MASSLKNSLEIEAMIDEVKTLMIKVYYKIFEIEYGALYKIALDTVKDKEAAKNILEESLNETVVTLLESSFDKFKPADISNNLIDRITESCQKYIEESHAEKEFQMFQGENANFENSSEDEIIKSTLKALDKLPPATKKILSETLEPGATPRKVAENNNLEIATVLKMAWNAKQLLKKILLNE